MRIVIVIVVVLAAVSLGAGQERLTLTVPHVVAPPAAEFRVWSLELQRSHPRSLARIRAVFRETNNAGAFLPDSNTELICEYGGDEAETLLRALNKANLTSNTLEKRVIERCVTDKKIAGGAVNGTPQ